MAISNSITLESFYLIFSGLLCFLKWYELQESCSQPKENQTSSWVFQNIFVDKENETLVVKEKDGGVWFDED